MIEIICIYIWFCLCWMGFHSLAYATHSGSFKCVVTMDCMIEKASEYLLGISKVARDRVCDYVL